MFTPIYKPAHKIGSSVRSDINDLTLSPLTLRIGTDMLTTLRAPFDALSRSDGLFASRALAQTSQISTTIGGRIGSLETRLARTRSELRRAQNLRYRVFYKEMAARADTKTRLLRRDQDRFDAICDHLLVLDHDQPDRQGRPSIVGTYRLLRQDVAAEHGGFYTQDEYDIAPLMARHPDLRFLELGRSCVLPAYRTKRTVELLWHGIWSYVLAYDLDVMIGCASLAGTDPSTHAHTLSFLAHHAAPEAIWSASALPTRYTSMKMMDKAQIRPRQALKDLPPLIKGYLRLGGKIGDGAVIDHQFGTIDVLIILPVASIDQRYINHYGAEAGRFAA